MAKKPSQPVLKHKPCRGRPVDPHKADQILEVAMAVFMQEGYHYTNMDIIAQRAKVSKLTLYRRFPTKQKLFAAVVERKCRQYVPEEIFEVFGTKSAREALFTVGCAMFKLILSDDAINMYRMMGTEAHRHPELTQLFYESGPGKMKKIMVEKIKTLAERGELKVKDPTEAKDFFGALFVGSDIYMRRFLNLSSPLPSQAEIEAYVAKATDLLLRAYR